MTVSAKDEPCNLRRGLGEDIGREEAEESLGRGREGLGTVPRLLCTCVRVVH